jgi:hypothetical protein
LIGAVIKAMPKYEQLFLLMDVARDVVDHAKLAIRGDNLDLKEVEKERRRAANAFWEPALKAAIVAARDQLDRGLTVDLADHCPSG